MKRRLDFRYLHQSRTVAERCVSDSRGQMNVAFNVEAVKAHFYVAMAVIKNNNNNNTSICKAHIVSIRAESEAPAVARWRGLLEG